MWTVAAPSERPFVVPVVGRPILVLVGPVLVVFVHVAESVRLRRMVRVEEVLVFAVVFEAAAVMIVRVRRRRPLLLSTLSSRSARWIVVRSR